jgi:hypothetical protein
MPAEIRLPFSRTPAQQAGANTWRKRLLPVGTIDYKGQKLTFDRRYLDGLAQSYRAGAYDQVPFQIADTDNRHTNDPERTRGWVTGVEVKDDGLWVTAQVTPEGDTLLRTNPNLGVSARIVEDYARSDGKYYPAAIQHVLGTLDPRITGLGPWEKAVQMSNSADLVVDLSNFTFAEDHQEGGITMPDLTQEQQDRLARLLELDPARLDALVDGLADMNDTTGGGSPQEEDPLSDDELAALIEGMSDEEFAQLQAEYETGADAEPQYAGAGAEMSNGYGFDALELTNYELSETQRQLAVLQAQNDRQAFEGEKRQLSGAGIPPYIADLARPLLEGTGHTFELANGGGHVDGGLVMRRVLKEFGKMASGLGLDLNSVELGTVMDSPDTGRDAEQARDDVVSRFRSQVGI